MKPILILGGSMHQLLCIEQAVESCEVHCIDYLAESPGHRAATYSYLESTTDIDQVLAIAREHSIAGILSPGTDIAVNTLATVAQALKLNGPSVQTAATMTNKEALHRFLKNNGFATPRQFNRSDWSALTPKQQSGTWIVKPTASSGSKGILVSQDPATIFRQLAVAEDVSCDGQAVVEEFLSGEQYTAEGFLDGGRFSFHTITRRITAPLPHTATHGQIIPAPESAEIEPLIIPVLENFLSQVAYADGPVDCDFVMQDNKVYLLEASPRLGGNFLSEGIRHSHRTDLYQAYIHFACSGTSNLDCPAPRQSVYVILLGVTTAGQLTYSEEAFERLTDQPGVLEARLFKQKGEAVSANSDGRGCLGYIIADTAIANDFQAAKTLLFDLIKLDSY